MLDSPEMKRQMQGEGLEPGGGPPDQFHQFIRRDVEKWRRVVKEGKLKLAG